MFLSRVWTACCKRRYAAPETFSPDGCGYGYDPPVEYDVKIDIFSFGVVLMEVINGSPLVVEPEWPITKDGKRILEKTRRDRDIKKMGEHKLKRIVLQCIEDSSKDRPSAEEVSKWLHYEWNKIKQKRKIAQAKVPKLKISVLGQSSAGKSSLVSRFLDNKFDDSPVPTIGLALRTANIHHRGKEYCLQIEDTAGQEKFHSIIPSSIRGVQGVLLVFDLTNRCSLSEGIPEMEQLVKENAPDSVSRILVGNKADLADDQQSKREISREEAERFAQGRGIPYIETSAYSGKNVEGAFELIAKEIYETLDLSDIDNYIGSTDYIHLTNDKSLWAKIGDCLWSWLFFWSRK